MMLWSCALDPRVCLWYIYIYIYIFLLFRLYDAQMMDRHCVNKMSVIVLLQPMDCQRAVSVHRGSARALEDVRPRPRAMNHPGLLSTAPNP